MCSSSIVFWCFVLLLVVLSSEHSTSDDEQSNNSVQYEFLVDSMKYQHDEMKSILCNSLENSIKNDKMQYKFHINSTKNDDSMWYESRGHIKNREENNQMFMESRVNSTENFNESFTKTGDESNSTSYEFGNTDDYNNNGHNMATIVSYETCNNVTCIQLCCPFGNHLTRRGRCVAGLNNYSFPDVYKCDNDSEDKTLDELFQLTVRDPCVRPGFRRLLHSKTYLILPNGSLYQGPDKLILSSSYCLAIFNRNIYDVFVCQRQRQNTIQPYVATVILVSLFFLLLTFVIYSILPELHNIHGYTMCAHVASLFIAEVIIYIGHAVSGWVTKKYCIPLAYILHFSFLSGFFWLNIICFDIWWTFRKIRSRETRVNKKDKKKFVIYSIYAWGISFILTVVCAFIDNVPGIPKDWILPDMCRKRFWLGAQWAKIIYCFIPISATIISNICFFIATSVTILYQKRDAHQLRDSESRRHDENKQRFNMYLKLFIVMGITWIMQVIVWLIEDLPRIVWNLSDFMNPLQNVMLFIIFVCKKKIMQLLLKRFRGQNCGPFCKIQ